MYVRIYFKHTDFTRVSKLRKNLCKTIPCKFIFPGCKAKIIPIYSFLTHAVLRVPVSDTGTAVASMGFISFELMHLLKKMLCACFLFMAVIPMAAQEGDAQDAENTSSRYIGLQGGVPFGTSTFSSFGADKTRAGFDAGLYGGYRFNPVLSLEAQAAWGRVNQSVQECCAPYWLGSDLHRYEAPVAGLEGWSYADLKSRVATQRYGLQLNMNLLGFFARTKDSRWSLDISPALSAIGTDSSIRTIAGGNEAVKGNTRWHFGAGGNVQAGYMLTRNLHIGIYSGITYLTGDAMDGLPEYRHKNNFIWESGLRLGWTFRGKEDGK